MTAAIPRRLSVAEMQAALDPAWRGEFAHPGRGQVPAARGKVPQIGAEKVARLGGRPDRDGPGAGGRRRAEDILTGPVALVLAAHSGAGASTVGVLLSDAAASVGVRARLLDCADPARSGVAGATDTELGQDVPGWRRGRRGDVLVDRLAGSPLNLNDVAPPPRTHLPPTAESLTVLDAGWPAWDLLAAEGWLSGLLDTAALVLVCRATVAGVRQIEQVLAALPFNEPSIAVLGPATWPGVVTGTCGVLLRAAREEGRVVSVPLDRHLAVTGLTAASLPKQLLGAGRSLARLVLPDLGEQSCPQQPMGTSGRGGHR